MNTHFEAGITINGRNCIQAEAMTIRCALEHMASWPAENGLGDDEIGMSMKSAYLTNIESLREKINPAKNKSPK